MVCFAVALSGYRWQRAKTIALVLLAPILIIGCLLMGAQKIVKPRRPAALMPPIDSSVVR
ncbi:hypothetical protein DFR67_1043 [Williamsia limnetica]|uniref:Uncharacterized protein n=1 Tax=Williamsia limnetica TaxID=882452 RepID=A0A318S3G1_WILLI|nr:hypothetical protein DFR67_1043 [Williamsia limnetica]